MITVLLSGAVSLWGYFYIMPYSTRLPRFNKEKFLEKSNQAEYICPSSSSSDHCIPVKDNKK